MVDAVGKPNPFQVDLKIAPVFGVLITAVILVNMFQRAADRQVVFIILIPDDVAACIASLTQIIDIFFNCWLTN